MDHIIALLREFGIRPTSQRIAVAQCLLGSLNHPTAEEIWECVSSRQKMISRATVYNSLNHFIEKGFLKQQILREGTAVYDPNVKRHHHFIDEETGDIYDIPWDAITVSGESTLDGFEVQDYQVIMRGRRRKAGKS
jgi:Fur family transcriptional regulator, iron response regulator